MKPITYLQSGVLYFTVVNLNFGDKRNASRACTSHMPFRPPCFGQALTGFPQKKGRENCGLFSSVTNVERERESVCDWGWETVPRG